MEILIATVGLPRSGKTTWARKQGLPIVCPDAVRYAVYGQRFWRPGEASVWATVWIMVRSLFLAGHDQVILDACNSSSRRRAECVRQGGLFDAVPPWSVEFHTIRTSEEVCLQRAEAESDTEIIPLIKKMAIDLENDHEDGIKVWS